MANTFFKPFAESDRTSSRTLLHEVIPITGTLVSGTYDLNGNWKSFSQGMFKSVYDYPYLSSSANHIFDVSFGYAATAPYSGSTSTHNSKKINIYNQMAQVLVGYDTTGSVRLFDMDGNFTNTQTDKASSAWFVNFSRLLVKDEIKKGSFSMTLGTTAEYGRVAGGNNSHTSAITLTDVGADTNYKINSPAGEYGLLKFTAISASATVNFTNSPTIGNQITILALNSDGSTTTSATFTVTGNSGTTDADEFSRGGSNNGAANFVTAIGLSPIAALVTTSRDGDVVTITQKTSGAAGNTTITSNLALVSINGGSNGASGAFTGGRDGTGAGLLYYQAGVAVLTGSIFGPVDGSSRIKLSGSAGSSNTLALAAMATGSTIDAMANGFLHRVCNVQFNNTTELNSTIYFCRASHNEFNYSSNPTYLSNSKVRVKNNNNLTPPRSYVTTVGLYSADNELLAVAKLSEPLRKDPTNELTLRVRLDY